MERYRRTRVHNSAYFLNKTYFPPYREGNIIIPYGKNEGIVKSFTSWGLRSNPPRVKDFRSLHFFHTELFSLYFTISNNCNAITSFLSTPSLKQRRTFLSVLFCHFILISNNNCLPISLKFNNRNRHGNNLKPQCHEFSSYGK